MAGPDGRYSDDYRATLLANAQGRFQLESIMPPAYGGGVPHMHVKVSAKGYRDDGAEYLLKPDQKDGTLDLVLAPLVLAEFSQGCL
jgi:protocatechuate 3,4-dioxygenase beta subunit